MFCGRLRLRAHRRAVQCPATGHQKTAEHQSDAQMENLPLAAPALAGPAAAAVSAPYLLIALFQFTLIHAAMFISSRLSDTAREGGPLTFSGI